MLHQPCGVASHWQLSSWGVEEDGNQESAHVVIIVVTAAHSTMVGGENKNRVLKPGLVLHLVEIALYRVVGVTDDPVHGNLTTSELVLVLIGNPERLMA